MHHTAHTTNHKRKRDEITHSNQALRLWSVCAYCVRSRLGTPPVRASVLFRALLYAFYPAASSNIGIHKKERNGKEFLPFRWE